MEERELKIRRIAKHRKRITFRRPDAGKFVKLKESWRVPKGRHNKMREGRAGKRRLVKVGYRTPKDIRGLSLSGMEIVRVFRTQDLQNISKEDQVIQIASTVGGKKRIEILK